MRVVDQRYNRLNMVSACPLVPTRPLRDPTSSQPPRRSLDTTPAIFPGIETRPD